MVMDIWEYLCSCFLGRNRILGSVEVEERALVAWYLATQG